MTEKECLHIIQVNDLLKKLTNTLATCEIYLHTELKIVDNQLIYYPIYYYVYEDFIVFSMKFTEDKIIKFTSHYTLSVLLLNTKTYADYLTQKETLLIEEIANLTWGNEIYYKTFNSWSGHKYYSHLRTSQIR